MFCILIKKKKNVGGNFPFEWFQTNSTWTVWLILWGISWEITLLRPRYTRKILQEPYQHFFRNSSNFFFFEFLRIFNEIHRRIISIIHSVTGSSRHFFRESLQKITGNSTRNSFGIFSRDCLRYFPRDCLKNSSENFFGHLFRILSSYIISNFSWNSLENILRFFFLENFLEDSLEIFSKNSFFRDKKKTLRFFEKSIQGCHQDFPSISTRISPSFR